MNQLKRGDIVYAIDNDAYRFTHPRTCFFGLVLGYYSPDKNRILVATIHHSEYHYNESLEQILASKTISFEKLSLLRNKIKHMDHMMNASSINKHLKPYLLTSSSIYPVRAQHFEKLPDISFEEFKRKYFLEVATDYFPEQNFREFSTKLMEPFRPIYNSSFQLPSLASNLPTQSL